MSRDQKSTDSITSAPAPYLILLPNPPHFTIVAVNNAYLHATMTQKETMRDDLAV
jgi:hypothetical protein